MSIALSNRVKELERRIGELEARPMRCTCAHCFVVGPAVPAPTAASSLVHLQTNPELLEQLTNAVQKRKPGRPPKNG